MRPNPHFTTRCVICAAIASLLMAILLTGCGTVTLPAGQRVGKAESVWYYPTGAKARELTIWLQSETEGATTLIGKDDRLRSLADLIDATSDPETRARLRAEYHALSSVYREEIRRNMEGETTLEGQQDG